MKKLIQYIFGITLCFAATLNLNAQGTCVTTSADGPYSVGIKVTYETLANGTDVKVIFELLDVDKTVDVAYLWNPDPNFSETIMSKDSNNTFSLTLTGQSGTISKACKMVINGGGQIVTQYVDYEVNTDCTGTNDVSAPDNFTATVGAITAFSVEFLLNATDDSGTVTYYVTYDGITKAISTNSGIEKSFMVSGLTSETAYNFNISARDLAGNAAANNPISIAESTTEDTSTACAGTSAENQVGQGFDFEAGYNYSFETLPNGTDVKFTFELLDDRMGVVAYLWRSPPDFLETQMNFLSGKTFTLTVAQTPGTTITYACKFAFQGGLSVTKYFNYDVGDDCTLGTDDYALELFKAYPNPTQDSWVIESKNINMASIKVYDILGKQVLMLSPNSNAANIDGSSLKSGLYFAQIKTDGGVSSLKLIKN